MKINELLSALNEAAEQEFIAPGFAGFYESIYCEDANEDNLFNDASRIPDEIVDWCVEHAEDADWEGYKNEVGETYIKNLEDAIQMVIPKFKAEFVEIESPGSYNYTTDRCVGKCNFDEVREDIKNYITDHKDAFKQHVKDNHSSYDGFISFYDNDADKWDLDGELDYNEIGSILGFILEQEGKLGGEFDLNYTTWEDCFEGFTFDFEEMKKNFKFDVEPETEEDLYNYIYDKETDTYKWNADAPGQMKLQFESAKDFLMQRGKVINEQKK